MPQSEGSVEGGPAPTPRAVPRAGHPWDSVLQRVAPGPPVLEKACGEATSSFPLDPALSHVLL